MGWIKGDQRSWGVRGSCLELAKFNFANIDGVEFSKIIVSATAKNKSSHFSGLALTLKISVDLIRC